MAAARNYNPNMSARQMTTWKYWIVANFYVSSFVCRPFKVFRILWNFVRGRETSKMESFLQETRRKFAFRRSEKKSKAGSASRVARQPSNEAAV
jgi:hypothetical protein